VSHSAKPSEPGWYDDPDGRKKLQRYWNGEKWAGAPRKRPPEQKWSGLILMVVGTIVLSAAIWWIWLY